jgi:hypothetical protein
MLAVYAGAADADDGSARVPGRTRATRARALRERGLEHFVHREYQAAADELMEAYRLDKRADTLFSWAEAVRATGDCPLATRIYQRLLDKTSDLAIVRQAEYGIATCEGAAPVAAAPGAEVEVEPTASAARVAAPDVDRSIEAEQPHGAGAALPPAPGVDHTTSYLVIGGGAVTALTGLAVYAVASDGAGIPSATHAEVTAARSTGDWQRLIGASIGVIGSGVTVYGVLRYLRDAPRRVPALALGPYVTTTGFGVAMSGRY